MTKVRKGNQGWESEYNELFEKRSPKAESKRRKEFQLQAYRASMLKKATRKVIEND